MVFVNEQKEDGTWQTIDKEKNITLSEICGPNENNLYQCQLTLHDKVIKFTCRSESKIHQPRIADKERQYEMKWQVTEIFCAQTDLSEIPQLYQIIKEALTAWGWNFRPEKAHSVSVNFSPDVIRN